MIKLKKIYGLLIGLLGGIISPLYSQEAFLDKDTVPRLEYLGSYEYLQGKDAFLYVDVQERPIQELYLKRFNNPMNLTLLEERNLNALLLQSKEGKGIIRIPQLAEGVLQFTLKFADTQADSIVTPYYDGGLPYLNVSDLPRSAYTLTGSTAIDKTQSGGILALNGQQYSKGFWIHAVGSLTLPLTAGKYERFIAHSGKQQGQPYALETVLSVDGDVVNRSGVITSSTRVEWDHMLTSENRQIKIDFLLGDGGNGNDHGVVGAPRLYYVTPQKQTQEIQWQEKVLIHSLKPFVQQLNAISSSSLKPYYTIIKGHEYATIQNQHELHVHTLPEKDSIIVEAYHPGDLQFKATQPTQCIIQLTKGIIVQKDERIELAGNEILEELIVHADSTSCGEVSAKEGIVQVKKLILKYKIQPKSWNFISFPSRLNIDKVSNLKELGYTLNNTQGGAYYFCKYDAQKRATSSNERSWVPVSSPLVEPLQGYLFGINGAINDEPQEITFTIDNVSLDSDATLHLSDLTIDMGTTPADSRQFVYISPLNAQGNTLKVEIDYQPADPASLPINYATALQEARITYGPHKAGIRLTLPDTNPAKVFILDHKKKNVLQAIYYQAPQMIDIRDLKPGNYYLLIEYGGSSAIKMFSK